MGLGKQKNYKGLKIVSAIVGSFFALSLITQFWLLYILVGLVLLAIWLSRQTESATDKTADNKSSFWRKIKPQTILVALTIVFPPAGLVLLGQHQKAWAKQSKSAILIISWLFIWFLWLGFITHTPDEFKHSHYDSDFSTESLDNYDDKTKNSSVSIPVLSNEPTIGNDLIKPDNSNDKSHSNKAESDNSVMSGVVMADPESVPYNRQQYQPNWSVGSGCDIRSRILTATSLIAVSYNKNGCTVINGSWSDPYTGQTLTGNPYRGDGTENDLDIDHIIPLNYVNSHGGYYWTENKKRTYGASLTAMNNGVYLAVSSSENRKKSDGGPAEYYPPNPNFRCTYSEKWRNIAKTYNISLSPSDYRLIESVLVSCGVE